MHTLFSRLLALSLRFGAHLLTTLSTRRPNSQKAWTTGTNPITQKSSAQPQQNGSVLQAKQTPAVKMPQQKDSATPDKHVNDRLLFILAAAIASRP
jgi:hypothetical protein